MKGWLRSNRPVMVHARVGRRVVPARIDALEEGRQEVLLELSSKRPGLKWIRIQLIFPNGTVTTLAHRLWRCTKQATFPAFELPLAPPTPESIELPQNESTPTVSIIIPVHNQTDMTLNCLRAIAENTPDIAYEVIVIDDRSNPGDVAPLKRVPRLRLHHNAENLGFVRNCNLGARMAGGRFLVFLNNDTLVRPDWLAALLQAYEQDDKTGLVGAKLIYPDGRLQEAGGIVWQDGSGCNFGRNNDPRAPAFNYMKEVDYCSGACILIATDLFERIGGFDERYAPAYYEDTDLAFRVREIGLKVIYQPRCEIIHLEGMSNGTDPSAGGIKRYQLINRKKFEERWHQHLPRQLTSDDRNVFHARDRSTGKPLALIIDHYVPRPDQDAGSRAIQHLIQTLAGGGLNVKFLPNDLAYDTRYTPLLEAMGVEVMDERLGPDFSATVWLREHGSRLRYAILSRADVAAKHMTDLIALSPARRLFYGHDLLSRTLAHTHAASGDPRTLEQALRWQKWERAIFPHVHAAYYPSKAEIAELRTSHPSLNARTLPLFTFPEPARATPSATTLSTRRSILFIGGFGHPPNREGILWFLDHVWPTISETHPDLRLELIGSRTPARLLTYAGDRIIVHGFVSDSALARHYRDARLAIAPLLSGGGVKGKILEALWHGTPMFTTPIGAEGIPDAETAMSIADPAEFASKLGALCDDPDRLATLAQEGRRLLARHFSSATYHSVLVEDIPELKLVDTRETNRA